MKLRLDPNVTYSLALEGGGAKGAYQIGAWKALREAGIRINAVAGTSVGALNGALIAMGDLEKAESVWKNIRFSKVMDVDDEVMHKLIHGDLRGLDLRASVGQFKYLVKNRGFDVTPLYNWMGEVVSEETLRNSDVELYIVTYSLSELKELELRAKDLPEGTITDMLLASAYLPVFRNEKLGGKRYADGGVRDVIPLHALLSNGYRDIIALRLFGVGVERPVRIPKDTHVYTVAPTDELGGTLEFEQENSRLNIKAGYYDTQRFLYGLQGRKYYIDSLWSEEEAYRFLMDGLSAANAKGNVTLCLREAHEKALPQLGKKLNAISGGYETISAALLETAAERAGLERWRIYTEDELVSALSQQSDICTDIIAEALAPSSGALTGLLPVR